MKIQLLNREKMMGGVLAFIFCAAMALPAQQRTGGYGGFGGGGYGGFGGNRNYGGGGNSGSSSSSSTGGQYNNNGTVGSAVISVDPDTHNIIVIADEETSEQISNVLRNLDIPKPQVLIKVVFMEVQHNNSSDLGVEGGWANNQAISSSAGDIFGLSGLNTVVTNFNALGQPSPFGSLSPGSSTAANASGGFYQIVGSDFQATLRAVAQAGKAQVLSRPSILARDGQMAEIVAGQEVYLPSGVSFGSVGNTTATIPTINGSYQNIGIILDVTPYIGANRLVQMILQPQTSAVDTSTPGQVIAGGSLFSSAVFAPNINIRSANTVVVTPDAQTVVIGGLIANTKSSNDSKVPFLGDIPVLGNLFKESVKNNTKDELLIFLTPHIVGAPSQLAALSGGETGQAPLITNSVSEQDLDRFLERVPVKKN